MDGTSPKTYSMIAIGVVIVCLIAGYFVFFNLWPEYDLAKAQHANAQADNARFQKALDSVQSFLGTYQNQDKNSNLINLALPTKNSDMANFVSSLSSLAQASGVALSNLQVTDQVNEGAAANSIKVQDLSLNASSSYLSFKDFMSRVEQHLRIVDVYHVSLSAGQASAAPATATPNATLQYQVKLRTYYQQ